MQQSPLKVVEFLINKKYGGFGLSQRAVDLYKERTGNEIYGWDDSYTIRTDPIIIQIVRDLGRESWGSYAKLKIVKIVDGHYSVTDYDGLESLARCSKGTTMEETIRTITIDPKLSSDEKIAKIMEQYTFREQVGQLYRTECAEFNRMIDE